MSPILDALGGALEKIYICSECGKRKVVLENFVALNFHRLNLKEVNEVRKNFKERNYEEGLVYCNMPMPKKTFFDKLMLKSTKKVPVLTLRDYLCNLNFTRNDQM